MFDLNELNNRIEKMQKVLRGKELDGAVFIHPIDVFYFTGTRQNAALWLPADGDPLVLVRKSLARARQDSPLQVQPFPSSKNFAQELPAGIKKVGMTFDVMPVAQMKFYQKLLPDCQFTDISLQNREVRSQKTDYEVTLLKNSGRKLASVFTEVPGFLKPGMSELEVAAEFEYRLRKKSNEGYVRMRAFNQELMMGLAVSSGGTSYGFFDGAVTGHGLSNASPQGASLDLIQKNKPILLDYTGVFNGYITDMTRIFVIGDLEDELKRAFDVSVAIQNFLADALVPGAVCEELFFQAVEMAEKEGLGNHFMGMPGEQAKFVGHGVGLELDEFPVIAQGFKYPLKVGNTIAIEPKFVFPGKGVVGIENTFVVTPQGGLRITDIPDPIVYL